MRLRRVPAVVISVAEKGAHGVSEDAKRTARVIAAYVSEQLAARGYLPAGKKAGKAKCPGGLLDKCDEWNWRGDVFAY